MQGIVEQNAGFEYTLWGDFHTSGKMVDMLNDIFDLIAENILKNQGYCRK